MLTHYYNSFQVMEEKSYATHCATYLSQRFGKRVPGGTAVAYPKRMLSRMGKRSQEQASRVLRRMSKRDGEDEETSRILTRMSKRNEETTRVLGRMTKRGLKLGRMTKRGLKLGRMTKRELKLGRMTKRGNLVLGRMTKRGRLADMRLRIRAEDEMGEGLGGSLEGLGMIHLGKHWLNLALDDRGSPRLNTWGRVSKRTSNDDGRRFSRIGMVKREAEMAKRSGGSAGGRFIRIGMVGDDEELRFAQKRSEANDQGSRWIRIGVNQDEHPDWGRIAKKAEGKEWNADLDKFDSDLLEESLDVGGADVDDDLWDNEVADKDGGRTMRDEEEEEEEEEGEEREEEGQKRRQWQRLSR